MTIEDKIGALPTSPGVYIMKDELGEIIYIGKAVVLKNRVRQYFTNTQKHIKVAKMVSSVADFEYIICLSEKDALSLEANLIKKHKPKYNILLKDDKHSPYIRIDLKLEYPTIEVVRKIKKDGVRYFGPYFSGINVWDIVAIIRSAYRMRTCPKTLKKNARECLNAHINLCCAPCVGRIRVAEYGEIVRNVMEFLSGRDDAAEGVINERMAAAAIQEDFERAILYRDQLLQLGKLKERNVADLDRNFDVDCFNFATNFEHTAVSVCIVRNGKLMGLKNFFIPIAVEDFSDMMSTFVGQYYSENSDIPSEVALPMEFDFSGIKEYLTALRGQKVDVICPKISTKKKLMEQAEKNARDYLEKAVEKEKSEHDRTVGATKKLAEILKIKKLRRIECYDISNISGTDKVASGIVFINGKAEKSEYRRYKIKTVEGANDFASMAEVIGRRMKRARDGDEKFIDLPDLVVVDGGKQQLAFAYAAMRAAGLDIPMVGLAKREEEIFTLYSDEPILLRKDSFPLRLLQAIRDEAHRFAITFHRNLRAKRYDSILKNVAGVGTEKQKKLSAAFSTFEELKTASVERLCEVKGIDKKTAENVYEYFHKTEIGKKLEIKEDKTDDIFS